MANENVTTFDTLNEVNVSDKTELKNGLTYLSWAWAWGELKKRYPNAIYTVYENPQGWNYFSDGRTCWVKCGVTINTLEHIEYLPVMDYRNKSIPANAVTSFDVTKAIQRCITKAIARHGLGLYIYAGEDLPEDNAKEIEELIEQVQQLMDKSDWDDKQVEYCKKAIQFKDEKRLRAILGRVQKSA